MAISQAMWVHGHSLQCENPALTVGRIGFGGLIRGPGSQSWYHLAIPTTVIVTDIRQRVDAAMLFFSSGGQGSIRNVHVWDGNVRIAAFDNLNLTGNQVFSRHVLPARPSVNWGIGISFFAVLGADPASAWIDVHSGGVDFV
ncbi:MAG TPA: DUF6623 family protein [Candidatus Limnocylindrales bacterium]|nr:DUF6623 family protein [Candidatus Limnocylindrales bacterium]